MPAEFDQKVVTVMRKNYFTRAIGWLPACLLILVLGQPLGHALVATPIKLTWNPANDPTVKGYALYYGLLTQSTPNRADVGTNLNCTISNLVVGTTYRIYAVSYNIYGAESIPSNELLYTPPTPVAAPSGPRLEIARQANGSMQLSCKATPGLVCGIQFAATPNPAAWQTLANVTADSISNIIATDISAKLVPQRFYRVALAAQPLISAITPTRLPNGQMRLDWTAPPLSTNRVLYAPYTTSTIWPTLATVVADAEGRASVIDAAAAGISQRFYRVIMP